MVWWSRRLKALLIFGLIALLGGLGGLTQVTPAAAASSSGLTVTPGGPLTDASDFITGLTDCGVGPVGMSVEQGQAIVTDYCDATTYLYGTTGATPVLTTSLANGLTHGIAQINGIYFGVASNNQSIISPGSGNSAHVPFR